MKKKNVVCFLILICLILLLGSVGCDNSSPTGSKSTQEVPTINFGYILSDHHSPLMFAATEWKTFKERYNIYLQPVREKELYDFYFDGKKIAQIKLVATKQGPELQNLMAQGSVDIGITGTQALILSVDKGLDAKLISPLQTEGNEFVLNKELPPNNWIEFVEWVKRRQSQVRIGIPGPDTIASIIFRSGLQEEGITFTENPSDKNADILLVDMKGHGNLLSSLNNGIVDGFIGAQPFPASAVNAGIAKSICGLQEMPPQGRWQNHACCSIVATDAVVQKNRELVVKLEELMILAAQYANEDIKLTAKVSAAWLGVDEQAEELALRSVKFTTQPSEEWVNSVYLFTRVMEQELGKIDGRLKGKKDEELGKFLFNFEIYEEAANELKNKKFI